MRRPGSGQPNQMPEARRAPLVEWTGMHAGRARAWDQMSIEDNKRLVCRYLEEVVNTGNVDAVPRFISPDYVEVHKLTRNCAISGARLLPEEGVLGHCPFPDRTRTGHENWRPIVCPICPEIPWYPVTTSCTN